MLAGTFWRWLLLEDEGLLVRIGLGVMIFAALALVDLRRRGRYATRWREYLFLLAAVGAAMAYGVINDQITCTISWQYFQMHDAGIAAAFGDNLPPPQSILRWEALKLGLKATWSGGLIIGAAMLIANNPRSDRLQLPYRSLFKLLLIPWGLAAVLAIVLGLAGYAGLLSGGQTGDCAQESLRFLAVFGSHLGGYIGGAIGLVIAVVAILLKRRATATEQHTDQSQAGGS